MIDRAQKDFFRFLALHLGGGIAAAGVFGGLLLAFDLGGLWTMIARSPDAGLWLAILFTSLVVTFGSVAMGIGIMGRGEERD